MPVAPKSLLWALFLSVLAPVLAAAAGDLWGFQPPYSQGQVPGWVTKGSAQIKQNSVHLTAKRPSQSGALWSAKPSRMRDWEAVIEYRVLGDKVMGGDGFAFWYAATPSILGPVYGSVDYWRGIGLFIDTFDNDGDGKSPLISLMYNDGTVSHIGADDGLSQALGHCSFAVRNLPRPSFLRVRYQDRTVTVDYALQPGDVYQRCFSVPNIILDTEMYFGFSAHTGDLSDNHQVLSLKVRDLTSDKVNLDKAHKEYLKSLQEQTQQHNQDVQTPQQFQSTVLTLLKQLQTSHSQVESTQLVLSEALNEMAEHITNINQVLAQIKTEGVKSSGVASEPIRTILDERIVSVIQQTADDSQASKIQSEQALREYRALARKLESFIESGGTSASTGGSGGRSSVSAADVRTLSTKIDKGLNEHSQQIRKLVTSVESLRNEVARVRASMGDYGSDRNAIGSSGESSVLSYLAWGCGVLIVGAVAAAWYNNRRSQHSKYVSQVGRLGWD